VPRGLRSNASVVRPQGLSTVRTRCTRPPHDGCAMRATCLTHRPPSVPRPHIPGPCLRDRTASPGGVRIVRSNLRLPRFALVPWKAPCPRPREAEGNTGPRHGPEALGRSRKCTQNDSRKGRNRLSR